MTDITIINVSTKEVVQREYNQEDLEMRQILLEEIEEKIQSGELEL